MLPVSVITVATVRPRPAVGWEWISESRLYILLQHSAALLRWPVLCLCDPAKVWIIHQGLQLKAEPLLTSKQHKSQCALRSQGEKQFLEIYDVVWFHKISCQKNKGGHVLDCGQLGYTGIKN